MGIFNAFDLSIRRENIVTPDGTTLRLKRLPGQGARQGTALITNSQSLHIDNFSTFMTELSALGWDVVGVDLRGHGQSTSLRAPLGHMTLGAGWDQLVSDFQCAASFVFDGVPWDKRLVVAPSMNAALCLDVLKRVPNLAGQIVLVSPPKEDAEILRLGQKISALRCEAAEVPHPDHVLTHLLTTYLGMRVSGYQKPVDILSGDPQICASLEADPLALPAPSSAYFSEMFRGIQRAWDWSDGRKITKGTRMLVLHGTNDPVTDNGDAVGAMCDGLMAIGASDARPLCVAKGHGTVLLDEPRLKIARRLADWVAASDDRTSTRYPRRGRAQQSTVSPHETITDPHALIDLCYRAIEDENGWAEIVQNLVVGASEISAQQLASLMPHYERALRIQRKMQSASAVETVLQEVMNKFGLGLVIVTPELEVLHANAAFCAGLAQIVPLAGQTLSPRDRLSLRRILRQIVDPEFLSAIGQGQGTVGLTKDGQILGTYFRPASMAQLDPVWRRPAGVIALSAPSQSPSDVVELLQIGHGLTAKEADVVAQLCSGKSPEAIARKMQVSMNTTRTHLKHIFEKTQTKGQIDLVTHIVNGPLGAFFTSQHLPASHPNG